MTDKKSNSVIDKVITTILLYFLLAGAIIAVPVCLHASFDWLYMPSYGIAGMAIYVLSILVTWIADIVAPAPPVQRLTLIEDARTIGLILAVAAAFGLITTALPAPSNSVFKSFYNHINSVVYTFLPHIVSVVFWGFALQHLLLFCARWRTKWGT